MKCILIGAGDLTIGNIMKQEEDIVIAVDGGMSYLELLSLEPDYIIGDFDSVQENEKAAIAKLRKTIPERIITLPREKDDTDMLYAIKFALEKGYRDFRIYAGMGGRLDHTFANIQCLLYLKNHDAVGYLLGAGEMILVCKNESIGFQKNMEGYLSLFSLGDRAEGVSISGMKYPLLDAVITNDYPIGISNEFIGEESTIAVENGALLVIVQYPT